MPQFEQTKYKWRLIAGAVILGLVSWYGFFQARDLIMGPRLALQEPADGYITDQPAVRVAGRVANVRDLQLNGRPIALSPAGEFLEGLPLSARYNIIRLEAEDKFGHRATIEQMVILSEPIPSPRERDWVQYLTELAKRPTDTEEPEPNDGPVEILEPED